MLKTTKNEQLMCRVAAEDGRVISLPTCNADSTINGAAAQKLTQDAKLMEVRYAAIKEREGWQTEQDMRLNWSRASVIEYFDTYYKMFESNTPEHIIRDAALDELSEAGLMAMIRRWKITDVMEMLQLEGYLTFVDGYFILSLDMFLGCEQ